MHVDKTTGGLCMAALLAACTPEHVDNAKPATPKTPACEQEGTGQVSGNAFAFSPDGGRVEGAVVSVVEHPDQEAITDADGGFTFEVPFGDVTLEMQHPDYPTIQTGTLNLCGGDLSEVSFQAPDYAVYELMAVAAGAQPDPDVCQLATTITEHGGTMYPSEDFAGRSHGIADATVTSDPPLAAEHGPVYFNLISFDLIYPDPTLESSTVDGGVLYVNVPPGEYTLRGHKDGLEFTEVRVWCRAGMLVNASPPWGITEVPI